MSVPELQRVLKLMRTNIITPSAIGRANLGTGAPKELLAQLSLAEFTRFVEAMKSSCHETER